MKPIKSKFPKPKLKRQSFHVQFPKLITKALHITFQNIIEETFSCSVCSTNHLLYSQIIPYLSYLDILLQKHFRHSSKYNRYILWIVCCAIDPKLWCVRMAVLSALDTFYINNFHLRKREGEENFYTVENFHVQLFLVLKDFLSWAS